MRDAAEINGIVAGLFPNVFFFMFCIGHENTLCSSKDPRLDYSAKFFVQITSANLSSFSLVFPKYPDRKYPGTVRDAAEINGIVAGLFPNVFFLMFCIGHENTLCSSKDTFKSSPRPP